MDRDLEWSALLRKCRIAVKRDGDPTPVEARDLLAGWWEALHAEIVNARRDTLRGGPNLRVGPDDVEHAHLMGVWLRHEARDAEWKADDANLRAAEFWKANRPNSEDSKIVGAAYVALPDVVKERLSSRPRSPEKRTPPLPRPRDWAPARWPVVRPGTPWSEYLSELLVAFRSAAGVVEREPGEDAEEDQP